MSRFLRVVWIVAPLVAGAISGTAWSASSHGYFGYEAWRQRVIERHLDPDEVVYPFGTTPEMLEWATRQLQPYAQKDVLLQLQVLQDALLNTSYSFAYEKTRTLTAGNAFAAREGNCISFTSLFVAISRSLGIETFLVAVRRPPGVERVDDVTVVNQHVVAAYQSPRKLHIYDFYSSSTEPYHSKKVIDDVAASAIFHTNLGAEDIRNGDLEGAHRHLAIAPTLEPGWAPAWINLGVAEFRSGDVESALEAYRSALLADPGNPSALTNMAIAYRQLGREDDAEAALRAAADDTTSPFTLIEMADIEMEQARYESARRYLRRARRLYGKHAEVFDALARLAVLEGDPAEAERYARRAEDIRHRQSQTAARR